MNLQGNTKVKITGSAEPEMLTPGTCVRFTARIDKRTSKAQEKIDKITIFTQTPGVAERTLGVELASEHPLASQTKPMQAMRRWTRPPDRPGRSPGIAERGTRPAAKAAQAARQPRGERAGQVRARRRRLRRLRPGRQLSRAGG